MYTIQPEWCMAEKQDDKNEDEKVLYKILFPEKEKRISHRRYLEVVLIYCSLLFSEPIGEQNLMFY